MIRSIFVVLAGAVVLAGCQSGEMPAARERGSGQRTVATVEEKKPAPKPPHTATTPPSPAKGAAAAQSAEREPVATPGVNYGVERFRLVNQKDEIVDRKSTRLNS